MMMVPSGAKDPFWENRARDVLTAAIARTCLQADPNKRSLGGAGCGGVDNEVFYRDTTMMLLPDAKKMVEEIVKALA